jgi:type II secretion system protein N
MTQKRTIAAYAIYLVAITVFFLYTAFPKDTIRQIVNSAGANQWQIVAVSVQQVFPAMPPGIVFKDVRLSGQDSTLLQMARLRLAPDYLALATGMLALHFSGDVHGGSASGDILGIGSDLPEIRIRFAALDLAQLEIITAAAPKRAVTGRISGQCRIVAQPDRSVRIALEIMGTDATVGLLLPIGSIRAIPFDSLNIMATVTGKTVAISSCAWKSALLAGNLSGMIGWQGSAGESTVALRGEVIPQQDLIRELGEPMASRLFPGHRQRKNGFQVTVNGTVEKPRFDIK